MSKHSRTFGRGPGQDLLRYSHRRDGAPRVWRTLASDAARHNDNVCPRNGLNSCNPRDSRWSGCTLTRSRFKIPLWRLHPSQEIEGSFCSMIRMSASANACRNSYLCGMQDRSLAVVSLLELSEVDESWASRLRRQNYDWYLCQVSSLICHDDRVDCHGRKQNGK